MYHVGVMQPTPRLAHFFPSSTAIILNTQLRDNKSDTSIAGAKHKRPICGRLGAELLLVADCLNSPDHDQEDRLRLRISKLMKAVETICRVSANRLTLIYSTWVIERDGKVVNIHVIVNAHFSGA
ncbi:hypothetical protein HDV63DRAFT_172848 [Trichoderma sp. SZMC 28014]